MTNIEALREIRSLIEITINNEIDLDENIPKDIIKDLAKLYSDISQFCNL